jgi:hypothetical protein
MDNVRIGDNTPGTRISNNVLIQFEVRVVVASRNQSIQFGNDSDFEKATAPVRVPFQKLDSRELFCSQ